ncbi:MAG: class II aldolase/adducin family protein [Bacillota bacterium]
MEEKEVLKGLEKISQKTGACPDMVQGGGGNTSAKLNERIMAIKASGYKLSQITVDNGYVKVNYKNLLDYFENVDTSEDKDFEKECSEIALKNVVSEEKLKPSVETGFHSLLKRYVLHSHSVYANIINCVENGEEVIKDIFAGEKYNPLPVRYTHPGFDLTLEMKRKIEKFKDQYEIEPEVIFLENHGLIITHDKGDSALAINEEVNSKIKDYLGIKESYPEVGVEKIDIETYHSTTEYLQNYFQNSNIDQEFFNDILYPDQIVYLEDSVSINGKDSRINIDTDTGEIVYKAKYNEAKTIDETLTSFIYIRDYIEDSDLTLKTMPQKYIDLIKVMRAESHRKKVMRDMEKE